jgi:Asp-tRNA(Asn)/Glu-tRNA(Gln) amidotransferase A subunit family amidase
MTEASRSYASHADDFRSGRSSPSALLEVQLSLIGRREPDVRAFVCMDVQAARAEALLSDARWRDGKPLSPIDGMAIAVKDIIETARMPTGQGSPLWTGFETRRDSASVQALRDAGVIMLGKSTTTEFAATEMFASTTNPHDPARTPGGSSSGSAAAVGAGFVPLALGSQAVGSTIRPASYCGCVGYKPTYGALNRGGSYDYLSHSCVGLLGRTLEDCWLSARAIAQRVGGDPGHAGLLGPDQLPDARMPRRLVLLETDGWRKASLGARAALEAKAQQLRESGIEVATRHTSPAVRQFEEALGDEPIALAWAIIGWEFRWPLKGSIDRHASLISRSMLSHMADCASMTQEDYGRALARRNALRIAYADLMASFDAAITLSATGAAPVGFTATGHPGFNVPASLLGVPAISLPLLQDEGMPLGLQLIGTSGQDAELFGYANRLSIG